MLEGRVRADGRPTAGVPEDRVVVKGAGRRCAGRAAWRPTISLGAAVRVIWIIGGAGALSC